MMLHPATVHFAMALPVVASVFGLVYLYSKSEMMSKTSLIMTLAAALAMTVAWYTGNQAGPEIFDYLSKAGKEELLEHKELGLYLAIATGIIALVQIVGYKMKNFAVQALAILLLLAATATTLLQGKHGGEIVYNYGMPFKAYMIEDSLHEATANAEATEDCDEKVEVYEDAIDEISSLSEEVDAVYGNTPKTQEEDDDE
ncbi:hypothetical protein MLC52_11800 [Sulfurimonas sp. NW15]|uniref:DUF2231 domain-containing protein n=1 Tax=Sulfurimonas sp. NW15 TaxID=2922729 RepID=UPI003DA9A4D2